jgi:bacterioferritin-associated ferredoxin
MAEDTRDATPITTLAGGGGIDGAAARRLVARPNDTLCFCLRIPTRSILRILERTGTHRVQDVTRICGAGGACNSCRTDIALLIQHVTGRQADMTFEHDDPDSR